MQDRYAGDVGDFGKYGLLRALTAGEPPLRLGVVWYLVDEHTVSRERAGDGRHTGYLVDRQRQFYEDCDPALYAAMRDLIESGERSVAAVERLGIFPGDTITYPALLHTPRRWIHTPQRLEARQEWVRGALETTADADLVFLDPDNGIEVGSVPAESARAPKYAFLEELQAFAGRNRTLVVYHHLGRTRPNREEIAQRVEQCTEALGRPVLALRFCRGTPRVFLIAPARPHARAIRTRIDHMLAGPWSRHFELY